MRVIAKPEETESTLDALLATTFVIRVDRATLSVIAPLLSKCLKSRQSNMHRKAGMVSFGLFGLVWFGLVTTHLPRATWYVVPAPAQTLLVYPPLPSSINPFFFVELYAAVLMYYSLHLTSGMLCLYLVVCYRYM